MGPDK